MASVRYITPEQYRRTGLPADIRYELQPSPYGRCLLAVADNALCGLSFTDGDTESAVRELSASWNRSVITRDKKIVTGYADRVWNKPASVPLLLKGTPFQLKVWETLLTISSGSTIRYGDVARMIGQPTAVRAVGSAVGANPVAYLVPCHRVIAADGGLGGYRWGLVRKKSMLERERADSL